MELGGWLFYDKCWLLFTPKGLQKRQSSGLFSQRYSVRVSPHCGFSAFRLDSFLPNSFLFIYSLTYHMTLRNVNTDHRKISYEPIEMLSTVKWLLAFRDWLHCLKCTKICRDPLPWQPRQNCSTDTGTNGVAFPLYSPVPLQCHGPLYQ
jgi:hypothetical protein